MRNRIYFPIFVALLLFFPCIKSFARGKSSNGKSAGAGSIKVEPSENSERAGEYEVKTENPQYNYFVCVPSTYSPDTPAGIHLFFHGMSDFHSAPDFGLWKQTFLEKHNLIGLNMQFLDMKLGVEVGDEEGKIVCTQRALAQIMADYHIAVGRGAISSYSGGGGSHALMIQKFAGKGRGPEWPFNHSALYSSNFYPNRLPRGTFFYNPENALPMSWFVSAGQKEWIFSGVQLGLSQSGVYGALLVNDKACPDLRFMTIDKGHVRVREEVEVSSVQFERSDLAFAPFVPEKRFAEKDFAVAVKKANTLALGDAYKSVEALLKKAKLDENVREKAGLLKSILDLRIRKIVDMTNELAANDPQLLGYYGPIYAEQLKGLAVQKEIRKIVLDVMRDKNYKQSIEGVKLLKDSFGQFFTAGGKIADDKRPTLEKIRDLTADTSQVGKMVREFLDIK